MKIFIQCVVLYYLFGLLYGRSVTEDIDGMSGKLEHLDHGRNKRQDDGDRGQREGRKEGEKNGNSKRVAIF